MEKITELYNAAVLYMGLWQLIVAIVVVVLFVVQMVYYLSRYPVIASFRARRVQGDQLKAVSVIVPLFHADFNYLQYTLPVLLSQNHPDFEVVMVDITGDEEFGEQIKVIAANNSNFRFTRIKPIPHTPITTKMALNVGIKAAHNECLVFTTADSAPQSNRWLELMAKGFEGGDIVLGYCGVECQVQPFNRLKRCARMAHSTRWLSLAMRGKPYRGTLCNMGFTKSVYFGARGFNYLNLNMGEDDLFVMKIVDNHRVNIVVGRHAVVSQNVWGGMGHWFNERCRLSTTARYYPENVKWSTGAELWSRTLFFAGIVVLALSTPLYAMIGALGLLLLRFLIVMFEMRRVARRLSEKGVMGVYPLYDIFSPLFELLLLVVRKHDVRRHKIR